MKLYEDDNETLYNLKGLLMLLGIGAFGCIPIWYIGEYVLEWLHWI